MIDLNITQNQQQNLVITPELRQAINILHYSSIELKDYLNEQALENPLIEINESPLSLKQKSIGKTKFNNNEDNNYVNEIKDHSIETLETYLLKQIQYLFIDRSERIILTYMIRSIDNNGYLQENLNDIASQFSTSYETVEHILTHYLQKLEPIGIGARNLKECLLLQLKHQTNRNQLAELIVNEYLEIFATKQWKKLSTTLNVPLKKLQYIFDYIQSLNPKPGSRFSSDKMDYVVPDLVVREINQQFKVMINDQLLPDISLNSYYYNLLKSSEDNEYTGYVKAKFEKFKWLKKNINQRNITLTNVMNCIVDKQRDFFQKGESHLHPLTMREVADEIGVHESTVSRATTGKYVQTPFGVYELKYFFTSSLKTDNLSSSTSSKSVKQAIQQLVNNENKTKPLSDQKIVITLKEKYHINISRRTVAKYREQLNIHSSSKRKRYE